MSDFSKPKFDGLRTVQMELNGNGSTVTVRLHLTIEGRLTEYSATVKMGLPDDLRTHAEALLEGVALEAGKRVFEDVNSPGKDTTVEEREEAWDPISFDGQDPDAPSW